MEPETWSIKNDKLDLKIKTFCSGKDTANREKWAIYTLGETICQLHTQVSLIYKMLSKATIGKQITHRDNG